MGIDGAETVACHMYRMALMAMVLQKEGLDTFRCLQLALVHDLAESIVGDITPRCGISREQKHQLEAVLCGTMQFPFIVVRRTQWRRSFQQ